MDGVYIALGIIDEMDVNIFLIDDGVYCAIKKQHTLNKPSIGDLIYTLYPEAGIYIYLQSLIERNVDVGEIVEVAKVIGKDEALKLIKNSEIIINL
jgi:tRNA 2-thiouridine synthesizing protein C